MPDRGLVEEDGRGVIELLHSHEEVRAADEADDGTLKSRETTVNGAVLYEEMGNMRLHYLDKIIRLVLESVKPNIL